MLDLRPGSCQPHSMKNHPAVDPVRYPVQGCRHLGCHCDRRRRDGAHDGDEFESAGAGRTCRPGGSSRLRTLHRRRAAGGMVLCATGPRPSQCGLRLWVRGGDSRSPCRVGCRMDAARDLSLLCRRRSRGRRSLRRQSPAADRSLARRVQLHPDDGGCLGGRAAEHHSGTARRPRADHS